MPHRGTEFILKEWILISLIFLPTSNHEQRRVEEITACIRCKKKVIVRGGIVHRKLREKIAICSSSLTGEQKDTCSAQKILPLCTQYWQDCIWLLMKP